MPPTPTPQRVLVTGASGYVGSRLVPALLDAGHDVVAAGRHPDALRDFAWGDRVDTVELDVDDEESVLRAVRGVDAVVYLVHSMSDDDDFVEQDREAAERMAAACEAEGVGRLVYLSGLIPDDDELSAHLRSRLEVEQIFLQGSVPATVLRAAMVIGAGSTSFELMRRMSERVPVTPVPTWMLRRLQPVSVEDIVLVLTRALDGDPRNRHYDVGGDDVLSYRELLALFAEVAGLRRPQVVVPFLPSRLVSEIVALVSGIPRGTVTALVESLSHDMVCQESAVRRDLVPGHRFLSIRESFERSVHGGTDATDEDGDIQGEAETDPEWAGSTRA